MSRPSLLVVRLGWSTSFALGAGVLVVAGVAMLGLRPVSRTGSTGRSARR